jgi:rare lipoprotein A
MAPELDSVPIGDKPVIRNYVQQFAILLLNHRAHLGRSACVTLIAALVATLGIGCSASNAQYGHTSSDYRSRMHEESLGRRELTSARPIGPSRIVTASWYGPGYSGHRTASGERFNSKRLSAASTTLPLGTLVRVKNLENGRSADVTINDRGPGVHGRSLDLTPAAAREIGLHKSGVARVKVTPISAN